MIAYRDLQFRNLAWSTWPHPPPAQYIFPSEILQPLYAAAIFIARLVRPGIATGADALLCVLTILRSGYGIRGTAILDFSQLFLVEQILQNAGDKVAKKGTWEIRDLVEDALGTDERSVTRM